MVAVTPRPLKTAAVAWTRFVRPTPIVRGVSGRRGRRTLPVILGGMSSTIYTNGEAFPRCGTLVGAVRYHTPNAGSYNSALVSRARVVGLSQQAPTIRTLPFRRTVETVPSRLIIGEPVADHKPVIGSYRLEGGRRTLLIVGKIGRA